MYNTDLPTRADLPSTGRLIRSTIIAALAAIAILVTIVLPSEYGIDPTRLGGALGLTDMGEIKMQLAAEGAADRQATASGAVEPSTAVSPPAPPQNDALTARIDALESLITDLQAEPPAVTTAPVETAAAPPEMVLPPRPEVVPSAWRDEVSFTLTPGQGAEIKMVMTAGAVATFQWSVDGGVVNFDTHGDGGGQNVSYEQGRGVSNDDGTLQAEFDGNHGWFWRNRGDADVVVTLRTGGDYTEIKRLI